MPLKTNLWIFTIQNPVHDVCSYVCVMIVCTCMYVCAFTHSCAHAFVFMSTSCMFAHAHGCIRVHLFVRNLHCFFLTPPHHTLVARNSVHPTVVVQKIDLFRAVFKMEKPAVLHRFFESLSLPICVCHAYYLYAYVAFPYIYSSVYLTTCLCSSADNWPLPHCV